MLSLKLLDHTFQLLMCINETRYLMLEANYLVNLAVCLYT